MRTVPTRLSEDGASLEASITAVKRAVYLVTFPVLALALAVVSAFGWSAGAVFQDIVWSMPLALVALILATLALWQRWLSLRRIEYGLLGIAVVGLVSLMVDAGIGHGQDDNTTLYVLASLGYWLPVLYGFVFMVFGVRTGAVVSLALYGIAVASGLSHFLDPTGHSIRELLALGQAYLSNIVVIVVLIGVTTILQRQVRHSDRLEEQVHTDVLTGLPNRRLLGRLISEEAARAERYQRPFSIVLFDLDHFKLVNDQHGHPAGDEVLKRIGPLLSGYVRETDSLGRWGGEEFLVLLPEMDVSAASQMAERLRQVIEAATFPEDIHLTSSFGAAQYRKGEAIADLLQRADKALYAAKDAGRNRVVPTPPSAKNPTRKD